MLFYKKLFLSCFIFFIASFSFAATKTINVLQYNLWNLTFDNNLVKVTTDYINKYQSKDQQDLDFITTQENSFTNGTGANLINFGLDVNKFALCGNLLDGSIFYNKIKWQCDPKKIRTISMTTDGGGSRLLEVAVFTPSASQGSGSPVLVASTHWCVDYSGHDCVGGQPNAHGNDAENTIALISSMMQEYPDAVVIFGGDLNTKQLNDAKHVNDLFKSAAFDNSYGKVTTNDLPLTFQNSMALDFMFSKNSSNGKSTLIPKDAALYSGVSDHKGIAVRFDYTYDGTEDPCKAPIIGNVSFNKTEKATNFNWSVPEASAKNIDYYVIYNWEQPVHKFIGQTTNLSYSEKNVGAASEYVYYVAAHCLVGGDSKTGESAQVQVRIPAN